MATTQQLTVEFRGGAFDGHLQVVGLASDELNDIVMLPVNADLIESLAKTLKVARSTPTSVAVYELIERGSLPRYEFLGAVRPEDAGFPVLRA